MTRILRLDAGSRTDGSYSRDLAQAVQARLLARDPKAVVVVRDLTQMPVPHIAAATIEGFYTPAEKIDARLAEATLLSDQLIGELKAADVLLISTPMYNFSIPSALKAWIDHVVRIGQTFSYDGSGFTGLLAGKRAIVTVAYGAGGYLNGGPFAGADFVQTYLRFLLNFLGIADVVFIPVEATTADAATVGANVAAAHAAADLAMAA